MYIITRRLLRYQLSRIDLLARTAGGQTREQNGAGQTDVEVYETCKMLEDIKSNSTPVDSVNS